MERLFIAIKAALKAGTIILDIYNDPNSDFKVEIKSDKSPLSIADKEANRVIVNTLEKFDNTPILSEEIAAAPYAERETWKTMWIVDPLDGTKEFIKRRGDFTVNIAYVVDNIPVMGVIYVPVTKELYFGNRHLGGYKCIDISYDSFLSIEDLLNKSSKLPLKREDRNFKVVASLSHLSEETTEYINKIKQLHPDLELLSRGSSLKICMVCEGSADIYPRLAPTMEWDTAAGDAIARSAGKGLYITDEKTLLTYNKENLLNPFFIVK